MPGLLTMKWKCKQMVRLQERRELSMIKLSLLLTYSTYNNRGERRKKRAQKKLMCINYTTHFLPQNTYFVLAERGRPLFTLHLTTLPLYHIA